MLGTLIIVMLTLTVMAYIAIPLLFPSQADPLPDMRDPLEQDLEEERDALFRAIRELELRDDLADERRQALRGRYEAKAAKVLRSLDERQALLRGQHSPSSARPATSRRIPFATLGLMAMMVVSASALGGYVLPRIGADATVTTADADRLAAARQLQTMQREAQSNPTTGNMLMLADFYWELQEFAQARASYLALLETNVPLPATAYQRLGLLEEDINAALGYIQEAYARDPRDLDTLYALAEINYSLGNIDAAVVAWQEFLALPAGRGNATIEARLAQAERLAPVVSAVQQRPDEANLLALADVLWQLDERESSADVYFDVLINHNPNNAHALSRIGQVVFFSGNSEDAIGFLARARDLDPENLPALLFLGNAYFSLDLNEEAIKAWERYVEVAGGPERAGRVPSLIRQAQAQQGGNSEAIADSGLSQPELSAIAQDPEALLALADLEENLAASSYGSEASSPENYSEYQATSATDSSATEEETADDASTEDADEEASEDVDEEAEEEADDAEDEAEDDAAEQVADEDDPEDASEAMAALLAEGERIFAQECASCHGAGGVGQAAPPLRGLPRAADADNVRRVVLQGVSWMPAYEGRFSDDELAGLVQYVTDVVQPGDAAP